MVLPRPLDRVAGTECPPARQLEMLLVETLDENARIGTETHVEKCEPCQSRLEQLVLELGRELPALHSALSLESDDPSARDARARAESEVVGFLRRMRRVPGAPAALPHVDGYEILGEIGRGAVGIVYRARHIELNRLVALKMILAGPFSSPRARRRFRVESQAIARLRHPHIVQVHDIGEQDGCLYLSLELVEGGNLATAIAAGPRPVRDAVRIVAELAEAIEYAHGHGVIHRDLKPANVLFREAPSGAGADSALSCELKITDFGLAKVSHEDGADEPSVTQSGEFLGTPSYTAPEQARGDAKLVGPQADVYSLGAILYELLTGRPPFQGATVVDTLMQVAHHEVVPAVRLVPGVPRDVDTICSKCLQKEPTQRYASANDLAIDLRRFLAGEPIRARPLGRAGRAIRWLRRRPAEAAAYTVGTLLVLGIAGTALFSTLRSASVARAVDSDLLEVATRTRAADWPGAHAALERARGRLDASGSMDLEARLVRAELDIATAARLESIRTDRVAVANGLFDSHISHSRADASYAEAFEAAGFAPDRAESAELAARIAASDIRHAWIAALDDWSACLTRKTDATRRRTLLDIARRADPDPTGWLARARDPEIWQERDVLAAFADYPADAHASVELLLALGERLGQLGGDAVPLLTRIQRENPQDFWANLALGEALSGRKQRDGVRYNQAAVALRPESAVAANNLGRALALTGSPEESLEHFRRALRIDPAFAMAQCNIGNALSLLERYPEAAEACAEAVRLQPDSPEGHSNLGGVYVKLGRLDDAISSYRRAIAVDDGAARWHSNLADALRQRGLTAEAIEEAELAEKLDPNDAAVLCNLGLAQLSVGRPEEALATNERALAIDPDDATLLGNQSLMLRTVGRVSEALEFAERAVRAEPDTARYRGTLGLALAEIGRLDDALVHLKRMVELVPDDPRARTNYGIVLQTVGRVSEAAEQYRAAYEMGPAWKRAGALLGIALMDTGDWDAARSYLDEFIESAPPRDPTSPAAARAMAQVTTLIELERRLPEFLAGTDEPSDEIEAAYLAKVCRLRGRPADAARIAFASIDPEDKPRDDEAIGRLLETVRCAALAGTVSADAGGIADGAERASWRARAREMMRQALAGVAEKIDSPDRKMRLAADQTLARLRVTSELDALRVNALPDDASGDERADTSALWSEVDDLWRSAQNSR